MLEVVQIEPESKDWKRLIEKSHQTSLYVLPDWIHLHDVAMFGCYRGTNICGGGVGVPLVNPAFNIPYQGLLQFHKEDHKVAKALLEKIEDVGRPISVWNAPSLVDVRPFIWRWWDTRKIIWQPRIRYTYICADDTTLEPRARALVTDNEVIEETGDGWWDVWKDQAWVGPMDIEVMEKILGFSSVRVFTDRLGWVIWGVDLQERGYYLGSVGPPTNILHHLLRRHATSDLVGCNSPSRALFKRSFGGQLRTYYGMVLA